MLPNIASRRCSPYHQVQGFAGIWAKGQILE